MNRGTTRASVPGVRRPLLPATRKAEILKLTNLLSRHAMEATKRQGRLRTCMCDMCGHAQRRLEVLRRDAGGGS